MSNTRILSLILLAAIASGTLSCGGTAAPSDTTTAGDTTTAAPVETGLAATVTAEELERLGTKDREIHVFMRLAGT